LVIQCLYTQGYEPNYIIVLGSDEKVSDAYAMKNYMVHQIHAQKIIMEDQSMNTEKIWNFQWQFM